VHRDLKPSNILLARSGVKLLDFGLAKFAQPAVGLPDETISTPLTADGQILGTLQYMSPEQLQGQEADVRSDIFSFGLVLYEMLTGRRAFQESSQASLIAAILKEEPPPLASLQPLTPPLLDRTVTCSTRIFRCSITAAPSISANKVGRIARWKLRALICPSRCAHRPRLLEAGFPEMPERASATPWSGHHREILPAGQ
jgi:serine/threonine protein kinase